MARTSRKPGRIAARPLWFVLALVLMLAPESRAAFNGGISGWVKNESGVPQLGALVILLSPEGRVAQRAYSDAAGRFTIDQLFPGKYAIKVSLAQFVPLLREGIEVSAGERTYLDVQLSGLFTSLQLVYPARGEIRDMTDNWKWVLRASASTRPALRFREDFERERQNVLRKVSGTFSDTRGFAQVSAGPGARPSGLANESDLGTAFAVATSLFGNNDVVVSGNLGYGRSLSNSATAFRTTYSRDVALIGAPEVSVTVRQLQVPIAAQRGLLDTQGEAPALQTLSLGFGDKIELGDLASFEYGFLYESVNYVNRLNFVSPYGRLIYRLGDDRELHLRYASGVPQPDDARMDGSSLRQQVSTLGMFPRMALRDGRPTVQRTEHIEIAYHEKMGDGLLEVGVYQDSISDAAISAFVPAGHYADGNVLPDLFSRSSTLNGGKHRATGYRVSYARKIRERLEAALGYGSSGVLAAAESPLETPDVAELRDSLHMKRAHMITASLSTELPKSHTHLLSTYQWVSRPAAIAPDLYNDFSARSEPGWNLVIRQPLPFAGPLPGKLEATADFRNLLNAGYIPIQTFDGQQMFLLQAIRSYRGALSFVF
jgi:hypothetical protein